MYGKGEDLCRGTEDGEVCMTEKANKHREIIFRYISKSSKIYIW